MHIQNVQAIEHNPESITEATQSKPSSEPQSQHPSASVDDNSKGGCSESPSSCSSILTNAVAVGIGIATVGVSIGLMVARFA